MTEIKINSGERLSFYKLFKEKNFRVVIPIIQRDYAQGRKSKSEIRNNFLDALYTYLEEDTPNRDLDFIYGSIESNEDIVDFLPLDGQQRLTTLFLLHWYLYQISDNSDLKNEFKDTLLGKENKSLFTYKTRPSSTDFCNSLLVSEINMNNLLDANPKQNDELSKTIKNLSWYFLSWQNDPTIQAMLTMLDSIHHKFKNKGYFFERLMKLENPIITFLFLNLNEFKLTDDLYIKMNSRGKPLTPFENFKAKFEKYLSNNKNDFPSFIIKNNGEEKEIEINRYFSINIDNKWADLLWNYRGLISQSSSNRNLFDKELMNFIRVVLSCDFASNIEVALKEYNYKLEYLLGTNRAKKENDYSDDISFDKYLELSAFSKNSILFLINSLDSLANDKDKIKTRLNSDYKFFFNEEDIFKNALTYNFDSNHQRICFYAYLKYITNSKEPSGINEWMRIIHNLSHPDNSIIDSGSELAGAIKSVDSMLPYSDSILDYLKDNPSISSFSSWQVKEEIIKAHLISISTDWKEVVENMEKHKYFNGQIAFLLEFSGIIDYYVENKNLDWTKQNNQKFLEQFKRYSHIAEFIFSESYENRINNKNFIFERAVLTKGNYLTTASAYRKNLLSTNKVANNIKRDHSWKRLLRLDEKEEWSERRKYVKEVFDDQRMDLTAISKSLTEICKDETNTWRDYLIKNPSLINICSQGFIRFENENNILLYKQSQSNFYHVELYSYHLYKTFFEFHKLDFNPFELQYRDVRSIEDSAKIVFESIEDDFEQRTFEIIKDIEKPSKDAFKLIFKIIKDEIAQPIQEEVLKNILVKYGMNYETEKNQYIKPITGEDLKSEFLNLIQEVIKIKTDNIKAKA